MYERLEEQWYPWVLHATKDSCAELVQGEEKMKLIMDLDNIDTESVDEGRSDSSTSTVISSPSPNSPDIIRKKIMTLTEMTIYPNGQTYYVSRTWEQGNPTVVKTNKKQEGITAPETKKQEEEVY